MKPERPCYITKEEPCNPNNCSGRPVNVTADTYLEIAKIAGQTNRSMRYVATKLIRYGIKYLEIIDTDGD